MSTSSTQPLRARVVQLYCPEHDATVNNFIIAPSIKHADVLIHVENAFRTYNLEDIRLRDINGEPLYDNDNSPTCFEEVVHGERLLVIVGDERIRSEPELEVKLFLKDDRLAK
jgi:hypothetical protein